jgi:TonB family protein
MAPPPPPPPPHQFSPLVDGVAPLRVGGQIKPPIKTHDVKPAYPPLALSSGVQGVVIIEATIDSGGNVVHTRVLRGQPLLDQAATDAVQQWRFEPTMLNGAPVPVIMTVTVNFRADGGPRQDGPRTAVGMETPPVVAATQMAPPPPPPPPAPELVDGLKPVRVGGTIKPPVKTTHVNAVYPADALASNVGGVVILQATIDTAGNVVAAQVIKSIPMLDQAAIDAVEQWKFEPTLLNGVPTPLIMTVTVNFVAR